MLGDQLMQRIRIGIRFVIGKFRLVNHKHLVCATGDQMRHILHHLMAQQHGRNLTAAFLGQTPRRGQQFINHILNLALMLFREDPDIGEVFQIHACGLLLFRSHGDRMKWTGLHAGTARAALLGFNHREFTFHVQRTKGAAGHTLFAAFALGWINDNRRIHAFKTPLSCNILTIA